MAIDVECMKMNSRKASYWNILRLINLANNSILFFKFCEQKLNF